MTGELQRLRERLGQVPDPLALLVGLFASAPVGFQIYSADGRCLVSNRAFRDLFGADPPPDYNILAEQQPARAGVVELTRRALAGETSVTPPIWYESRADASRKVVGRRCAATCTAFPVFDAAGRVTHVALAFKDVTGELASRQEALAERDLSREMQNRLQALFDNAPLILFVKDLQGQHLAVSREVQRVLGIDPLETHGKSSCDLFGEAYGAVSAASDARVLATRTPHQIVELLPTTRGLRDFLVTRFPLFGAGGEPVGTAGIAIDISERREAEERLRASEQRLSQVFRMLPSPALLARSSDRRFLDVNEAWERLTGFTRDEQVGRTSLDLGLWSIIGQRQELFAQLDARGVVRDFPAQLHTKSGALREVLLAVDRIEIGGEDSMLLILHDVTDVRRLERELRQSQKMEAIGRLAGGLAHDFNNILTAIGGADTLLLDELAAGDPRRRHALQIEKSAKRAASLTQQLLTFTRKQPQQPVVIDPNDAVRAAAEMLQRMIGAAVELRIELGAEGRVKVDAGAIEQVVLNLAINARDAMPSGGILTLRSANDGGGSDGVPAGEWVRLTVRDTGVGMDADTKSHLFEPFFTTKEQGKGTGLGLSTVYAIVAQCRGHVAVTSEPGSGTELRVYLPRELAPATIEPAAAQALAMLPRGNETILLAEDDESVREFVAFVLRGLGYRVLEAGDGAEALAIADGFVEPIDLLLSDVVMPRMDGVALARALAPRRPAMKVLHVSGYPGDAAPGGRARLLNKPFDRDQLALSVRHVLDASH